ncbi:MAG: glycerate kinase [Ruminococcaceae bacterium]|nr:glycerate kinase [Oscillospiraceae bacterium]
MKVVAILDSFKGSISSLEAGMAVSNGVMRVYPDAEVAVLPLADGGEGTADALIYACKGERITARVTGPLGDTVDASYGILPQNVAVIEMSAAAGITLIDSSLRDPMKTTTYGVGELILDAIGRGCRDFLIGIGGSATNDGGVGMLQALGFSFLDSKGQPIVRGAAGLSSLSSIDVSRASPVLQECRFRVACDVTNPLCGELGCSAVYGPQKGATPLAVAKMDACLARYAALTQAILPHADGNAPGAGAAGGMGFALSSYLGAELTSGVSLVLDAMNAAGVISKADVVVTGEGRLDGQSAMGKAPVGVARLSKRYGKPVIALAGSLAEDVSACHTLGIDACFSILQGVVPLERAMEPSVAKANLEKTAEEAFRLIQAARRI